MITLREWVFNKVFQREILKVIGEMEKKTVAVFEEAQRQGSMDAFGKALADLKETNVYDVETKAEELAKKKLSDLLSLVDFNAIVSLNKAQGVVYVGGVRAEEGRLANLKAEAEFFEQSDLWKLISQTPREIAQRVMFVSGESLDDMKKGRSMLFTLDSQQKIIDTFRSFTPKK